VAAEDREKLRELLLPTAKTILAPRKFDLELDDSGITLVLDGQRLPIASSAEIASGKFAFEARLRSAAGVEAPPDGPRIKFPRGHSVSVSERDTLDPFRCHFPHEDLPLPEPLPECGPPMKMTRRAMAVLEEIKERHKNE